MQLQGDEILHLDLILEEVLQQLVIPPLRPQLVTLYMDLVTTKSSYEHITEIPAADENNLDLVSQMKPHLKSLAEDIHLSLIAKTEHLKAVSDLVAKVSNTNNIYDLIFHIFLNLYFLPGR